MMKKLLIIFTFLIGGFFPALAQNGEKIIKPLMEGRFCSVWTRPAWKPMVEKKIFSSNLPVFTLQVAQVTNRPDQPLLRVISVKAQESSSKRLVSARIINGEDFLEAVYPQEGYRKLPLALNDREPALYRGMALQVENIKNLLIHGVEIEKSAFSQLFFSADIDVALAHANEEKPWIPVVVKFNVTPNSRLHNLPYFDTDDNYIFKRSLSADSISDVLVFLEIDGKRGWYKATLENNELVFRPALTRLFPVKDLVIHKLDVRNWRY